MLAGHGFRRMGLVQDDRVVIWKDIGAFASQCEVGEEEGVVHHQHVRIPHAPAGAVVETLFVLLTFLAQTIAVLAVDLVPDLRERAERQVGQAAISGLLGPFNDLLQLVQVLGFAEHAPGAVHGPL